MHNILQAPIAIFGLALLVLFGCGETVFETVEVPVSVVPDYEELPQSRDPYKRIFQIKPYGDNLLFQSERAHIVLREDGSTETRLTGNSSQFREIMNEEFFIKASDFRIEAGNLDPDLRFSNNTAIVFTENVLPEGAIPTYFANRYSSLGSLDDDHILLLPYIRDTSNNIFLEYAILQFEPGEDAFRTPRFLGAETYEFEEDIQYPTTGLVLHPVDDGFVIALEVGNQQKIFRIDQDGSYQEVYTLNNGPIFSDFFEFQGRLYTYAQTDFEEITIFSADLDGRNWGVQYVLGASNFLRFHVTGGELFAYVPSTHQIFLTTEFTDFNIRLEALDASQFQTEDIMDIEKWNDDVYIATYSGFFRRDWQEFIESRLEE